MLVTDSVKEHFKREEGWRNKAYKDHLGYPTIGVGHLLEKSTTNWAKYQNLVWTDQQITAQLQKDIDKAVTGAKRTYGSQFDTFSHNVQLAIVDNIFQMGEAGYNTFVNSIRLIKQKKWNEAADNMLKSKWARQTPARAKRITDMIRKG